MNECVYTRAECHHQGTKCSECPLTDLICDEFTDCLDLSYQQGKADAFADCILENGEYCWQECCETEKCKECKWLGNGDTIWFEPMQKGAENE